VTLEFSELGDCSKTSGLELSELNFYDENGNRISISTGDPELDFLFDSNADTSILISAMKDCADSASITVTVPGIPVGYSFNTGHIFPSRDPRSWCLTRDGHSLCWNNVDLGNVQRKAETRVFETNRFKIFGNLTNVVRNVTVTNIATHSFHQTGVHQLIWELQTGDSYNITSEGCYVYENAGTIAGSDVTVLLDCGLDQSKVHCKVELGEFGECSRTCGSGIRVRAQTVVQTTAFGGAPCPKPMNEACNTQECPVDCEISWNDFGPCSKTCGGGVQTKDYIIRKDQAFGGSACPEDETRSCNTDYCPCDPECTPNQCQVNARCEKSICLYDNVDAISCDDEDDKTGNDLCQDSICKGDFFNQTDPKSVTGQVSGVVYSSGPTFTFSVINADNTETIIFVINNADREPQCNTVIDLSTTLSNTFTFETCNLTVDESYHVQSMLLHVADNNVLFNGNNIDEFTVNSKALNDEEKKYRLCNCIANGGFCDSKCPEIVNHADPLCSDLNLCDVPGFMTSETYYSAYCGSTCQPTDCDEEGSYAQQVGCFKRRIEVLEQRVELTEFEIAQVDTRINNTNGVCTQATHLLTFLKSECNPN